VAYRLNVTFHLLFFLLLNLLQAWSFLLMFSLLWIFSNFFQNMLFTNLVFFRIVMLLVITIVLILFFIMMFFLTLRGFFCIIWQWQLSSWCWSHQVCHHYNGEHCCCLFNELLSILCLVVMLFVIILALVFIVLVMLSWSP